MIEIKNVDKYYIKKGILKRDVFYALKDVNISFYPGKIYSIFGKSGSGKTTLANIISGYKKPDKGSVLYKNGIKIRYVFQDPYISLNITKDVKWHIETSAGLNNIDLNYAWYIFNSTGLDKDLYEYRSVESLSGGERQLLAFAMAYLQKPDVIVLDEAFSYLDTLNLRRVFEVLKRTKNNILYIYFDNDINRCLFLSDFIYVLNNGSLVESGTPDMMIKNPGAFMRNIIEKMPDYRKRI
ncbi:ATP-binding cassette domain-containing protein [Picrophilus oshimae]|uniref:ABC transporter n=1 Tax=Picrophilus torridus (strain ATCC 700027 / DSM 9790 / JCM 10055 / NBRC 100828 / KAW 2/3) TaxID=1122961 RepID=Q6L103_PICTO|nr:ATP-binding cassette domain-containing protein [Picrophilus oshimae]AAT43349.1 oligopeptide ABC transporter Dpp1, ATP binding protein [Picrophilus oshimae DSM 9789]SMD30342.1 ABC transporter [Picrophilus oshimae DSM 9789]